MRTTGIQFRMFLRVYQSLLGRKGDVIVKDAPADPRQLRFFFFSIRALETGVIAKREGRYFSWLRGLLSRSGR